MVSRDEIVEVTENVDHTLLGWGLAPVAKPSGASLSDPRSIRDPLAGRVPIAGEWNGAVLLYTSGRFAKEAASKMLAMPPEKVAAADLEDALLELTNMVGGNIKSLLPGHSVLGLPSVTMRPDVLTCVDRTRVENHIFMQCNGEAFNVVIWQGEDETLSAE